MSIKIDPDKLEELREIAEREKKSLTDVIMGGDIRPDKRPPRQAGAGDT